MDQLNDYQLMLEMLPAPAFTVKDGVVSECNNRALQMLINPGDPVSAMLGNCADDYKNQTADALSVTLQFDCATLTATITKLSDRDLFRIDESTLPEDLKGMVLLGNQIRTPVSGLLSYTDRNKELISADIHRDLARISRTLNNLSNVQKYADDDGTYHQVRNLCSVFDEVLEECATLLSAANLKLEYTLPAHPIYSLCDNQMLRQAVYNLLENAARSTPAGETIKVSITETDNQVLLSVTNPRAVNTATVSANFFSCYSRGLSLTDGVYGLGLGMSVVRMVAKAHGGTVLMDQVKDTLTRVTMTLRIRSCEGNIMRSPTITIVPAQEDGLIMLSNVLPAKLYQ